MAPPALAAAVETDAVERRVVRPSPVTVVPDDPRTIFVSDVHLGCKYANADAFLKFLRRHQPQYLYLVGDFFDGWRLGRRWYWRESYSAILHRLADLAKGGTEIFYTPGNHDEFARNFLQFTMLGNIRIANEFVHVAADGRRLLVTHGDLFDRVVSGHRWLSHLGDGAYNVLMGTNRLVNRVRGAFGGRAVQFSKAIKQKCKEITNAVSNFEGAVAARALALGCQGIVCGHIHRPAVHHRPDGVTYYNTGDWVENCSALVEGHDGRLHLLDVPA